MSPNANHRLIAEELRYLETHTRHTEALQSALKILAMDTSKLPTPSAHPILESLSESHPRVDRSKALASGLCIAISSMMALYLGFFSFRLSFASDHSRNAMPVLLLMTTFFTVIAAIAVNILKHALFPAWGLSHTQTCLKTIDSFYNKTLIPRSTEAALQGQANFFTELLKAPTEERSHIVKKPPTPYSKGPYEKQR